MKSPGFISSTAIFPTLVVFSFSDTQLLLTSPPRTDSICESLSETSVGFGVVAGPSSSEVGSSFGRAFPSSSVVGTSFPAIPSAKGFAITSSESAFAFLDLLALYCSFAASKSVLALSISRESIPLPVIAISSRRLSRIPGNTATSTEASCQSVFGSARS